MTNYVRPIIAPVEAISPKPPERFTQEDRAAANQCLQRAFENERIKRARNPTQIL